MFEHKQKANAQSILIYKDILVEAIATLSVTLSVKGLLQ